MERKIENGLVLISGGHKKPGHIRFDYRSLRAYVYKHTPQVDLEIAVHFPHDFAPGDRRAGALFFFGGGFVAGTREQFTRQCAYLASCGMIAATADYRVKRLHATSMAECVEDVIDALGWFRGHAEELGMDPKRIAVGGGSAGATLAAVLGVPDSRVADPPDALVLFNPALYDAATAQDAAERLGFRIDEIELVALEGRLRSPLPPTWIWFGDKDRLYERGKPVIDEMQRLGPKVELFIAPGADHGFFNDYEVYYRPALASLEAFLRSIGFISAAD